MYSLPSLAPQDSHSLWYTSSHATPLTPPSHLDPLHNEHLPTSLTPATAGPTGHQVPHRRHHASHHRHPLARLRMDEESMARRRQNVQNYGNSWIRPPGIAKSLYQMREEKREMEEHQEAMRREALAQELAEAEAEGLEDMMRRDGEGEGVGEMDEGRDLDEDVPEGDADVTGLGEEEDDEEEEGDGGDRVNGGEEVPRGVLASRMPEDVYREALVRGEEARGTMFGDEGGSTVDEEDRAQMLQEEDLVHETHEHGDLDMDGDVNLDDDIPEAEEGGYEHTDTEAELTSSEEESVDEGLFNRHQPASSMVRSDGTQNSMDIGSLRSQGSSQMGSSPAPRAGFRSRRGGP